MKVFKYIVLLLFLGLSMLANGQVIKLSGIIKDAKTGEPMSFVDIGFVGTTIGTSSDLNGSFELLSDTKYDSIYVMFLGYQTQYFKIRKNIDHINVNLQEDGLILEAVEIKTKRGKYSKKNNPAVDLANMVRTHKYVNSLSGKDYYKYKKHEKIKLSFNNISNGIKNFKLVKNIDFIFDYMEESKLTGKSYLPFFLRETLSNVYYKKNGNKFIERRFASNATEIEDGPDPQTINDVMDAIYHDIDIYKDQIDLLGKQFVSPFAKAGENFYRYYIVDTIPYKDKEVINLEFIPAIKGNLGFTGNIYISNDSLYTVLKVEMTILHDINLNFVNDVNIVQEFEPLGKDYIKVMDQTTVDYSFKKDKLGVLGTRTVYYSDFDFSPVDVSMFSGVEKIVYEENAENRNSVFWNQNRIRNLSSEEKGINTMIDSLNKNPYVKTYKYVGNTVKNGFAPIGKISLGAMATFVSYNEVEGVTLRMGGRTNRNFSDRLQLNAYAAYPLRTERWKYVGGMTYSFNNNYDLNPKHYIRAIVERESSFSGKELEFFKPESIFVSLQRGDASRMLFTNTYALEYLHEYQGFSYSLSASNKKIEAYGDWSFRANNPSIPNGIVDDITTTELDIGFRYAPNEKFLQGEKERVQLYNEYPIFNLHFTQGVQGVLGSDYSYSKIKFDMFKMFRWTTLGNTNISFEAGKSWGEIPYLLQFIPRGNQTYTFHLDAFNMMNFMEFTSDQYASFSIEHFFQGAILNRIPLIKKLKWREVLSFKTIFGTLADKNNPYLNPQAIQFPTNENGEQATFLFDQEPYMEASIGFTNIFKVLRVDVIKRINYLDSPNIPSLFNVKGLGIRFKFKTEF